jgi:hypothetical protein
MWRETKAWEYLSVRALRLSRYTSSDGKSSGTGVFWMILEGPTRGEIHAWSSST